MREVTPPLTSKELDKVELDKASFKDQPPNMFQDHNTLLDKPTALDKPTLLEDSTSLEDKLTFLAVKLTSLEAVESEEKTSIDNPKLVVTSLVEVESDNDSLSVSFLHYFVKI